MHLIFFIFFFLFFFLSFFKILFYIVFQRSKLKDKFYLKINVNNLCLGARQPMSGRFGHRDKTSFVRCRLIEAMWAVMMEARLSSVGLIIWVNLSIIVFLRLDRDQTS